MPTLDGLPHLATARELHPCHGSSDRPISMAAAEAIALGLATSLGDVDDVAPGTTERRRVLATATYDAWVVALGPQTAIEPHDHDGSIGVIAVTQGRLIEFGLDGDGQRRSRLRHLVTGDHTTVGITHRHSLVNPDLGTAVTVQVFSPPLGHD